jgi:GNAT superfamily N-acetyltransferase
VHVSLPATVGDAEAGSLTAQGVSSLTDEDFWRVWAGDRGLTVIGPSSHAYLDEDPGDDGTAPRIDPALLAPLRASVRPAEWREGGFDDDVEHVFGCFAAGRLVAAANLTDFAGAPRDVGLLVAPDLRGRGLGHRVGGAAASYAVRHHGFAAWRAFVGNRASLAVSRELGFEEYAGQLAVRAAD